MSQLAVNAMPATIDLEGVKGDYTILVEYRDNALYGASVARDLPAESNGQQFISVAERKPNLKELPKATVRTAHKPSKKDSAPLRAKSVGFSVRFADGTLFDSDNAKEVMIAALRKMGLDNANRYREILFNGDPLVGTRQHYSRKGKPYREEVDDWLVHVHLDNERKKKCLKGIADMLGYDIEIVADDSDTTEPDAGGTSFPNEDALPEVAVVKTTRTTYSLNGSEPMSKGRAILGAITQLLKDIPSTTYGELLDLFPRELQGNYGVMETLAEIDRRAQAGQDVEKRYFMKPGETLTSADGIQFAVCTQWDYNNFPRVQEIIRETLTYTLDETNTEN